MNMQPVSELPADLRLIVSKNEQTFEAKELASLSAQMKQIRDQSRDFVVDSSTVQADVGSNYITLSFPANDLGGVNQVYKFAPTPWAQTQICTKTGVPYSYYKRMVGAGMYDLACKNFNAWFQQRDQLLLRTVGPSIRAVLGPTYRVIDSYDVLSQVFKCVAQANSSRGAGSGRIYITQAQVNETQMYLRLIDSDRPYFIAGSSKPTYPGIIVKTSDVGDGALTMEPYFFFVACANGAIGSVPLMKRIHLGSRLGQGMYRPETLAADSMVIIMKLQDIFNATMSDREVFDSWATDIDGLARKPLKQPINEELKGIAPSLGLTDTEMELILSQVAVDPTIPTDARNTHYALFAGITAYAHQPGVDSYRRYELEKAATTIVAE